MRINKKLLILFTAAALATTSINPVNTYAWGHSTSGEYNNEMFSPVNTKAKNDDYYSYSIDTSSYDYINYTGKELSNIPISYLSNIDGDYTLKDGIDYQIVGYEKIDDIDSSSDEDHFTKGRPIEPGFYKISIEGINTFKGREVINVAIIDPTDLSSYDFRITDHLFLNSGHVELTLDYFDTEKQEDVNSTLKEGKDFSFDGWAAEKTYKKNRKNLDKIKWSKKVINGNAYYYFKMTGINSFKDQMIIRKFNIYGAKDISNYDFYTEPRYNPSTKKYESRLKCDYLTEGKDYSVSYCPASKIPEDDELDNYLNTIKWKPGYPKKSGKYVFLLQGKNKYKNAKGTYSNYHKYIKPQIIKNDSMDTTLSYHNEKLLVLCPSKSGEYTIKASAFADSSSTLYIDLYDYAYNRIAYSNGEGETTVNTAITATLEAGKIYFLELDTSYREKEIPCKISIDGSYEYQNPKTIVKNNCIYSITKDADENGKNGEVAVVGLKKKSVKKITISNYIKIDGKKYKVTHIDYNAFKGSKKLTSVKTGNSVKSICAGAFAGCKNLKTLVLGKNIKYIEKKALYRSKGKKLTIKVPKKNKKALKKLVKDAKTNNYAVK